MTVFYKPTPEELEFRAQLLGDEETMSYNRAWGGTIDFLRERRRTWYDRWVAGGEGRRFYRYLRDSETGEFVGEAAYHCDAQQERYLADVIVHARYRGRGYGREGLRLLCREAAKLGVSELYDNIALDNPAIGLFLSEGFAEEYRTSEIIMLKKKL